MIYIEVKNSTVSYIHYQPFDVVNGLQKSEEQLRGTGFLVDSIPDPEVCDGFIPVLTYSESAGFSYRYEPCAGAEPDSNETPDYDSLVNSYIRERYSLSQELALLRQQEIKTDEYMVYYAYAEQCKVKARNQIQNQ